TKISPRAMSMTAELSMPIPFSSTPRSAVTFHAATATSHAKDIRTRRSDTPSGRGRQTRLSRRHAARITSTALHGNVLPTTGDDGTLRSLADGWLTDHADLALPTTPPDWPAPPAPPAPP